MQTKKIKLPKIMLLLLAILFFWPFESRAETEEVIPANLSIVGETAWEGRKILNGSQVRVEAGATLRILPGTTIVGNNGAMLYILGKLSAEGEKERKIRFTANPTIKQSSSLTFFIESGASSEIKLSNFILERGGGNQGSAALSTLTIRNKADISQGIVKRNRISAIKNWGKDLKITDCEIYENERLALENKSLTEVKAENNWWGGDNGPNQSDTAPDNKTVGLVDFSPWQEKGPIPFVFLPGIGGSLSFRLFNDNFHDYWFLNPIGTSAYRTFVKNLILTGYEYEKNFFWGFYDWRLSNSESASQYLKKLIDEIKAKNAHFEVNLLAHSMGGLMARSYVQSDYFGEDVNRLVTLGTPHWGSSDIYAIWENEEFPEENLPVEIYLWYLNNFDRNGGQAPIVKTQVPSLGEMLPIYDYLKEKSSGELINYTSQEAKNSFLENLRAKSFLTGERVAFDAFAGVGEATLEKIEVRSEEKGENYWRDGKPDPLPPVKDISQGDNRVTELSAVAGREIGGNAILISSNHGELPEKGMKEIFDQMKIKPKNPWVTSALHYFIFGLSGLVDVIIEDGVGRVISSSERTIPDSQFIEDSVENKKLAYADFPIEVGNEKPEKIKIKLAGRENGKIDLAFWVTNSDGKFKHLTFEREMAPEVSLELEIALSEDDAGEVTMEVTKEKYIDALQFISPKEGERFLNWQKLKPELSFLQIPGQSGGGALQFFMNEEEWAGETINLKELALGRQTLKVKNMANEYDNQNQTGGETFEEKTVNFEVATSIKSLITLINRAYEEGEIMSWDLKSRWLSELALAYQDLSNGREVEAKEQLGDLREDILVAEEIREEERGSLVYFVEAVENNPE